jgi:hypothetical protein
VISRRRLVVAAAAGISTRGLRSQNAPSLPSVDEKAVEAKYANVIRKYGDRLSEPQRTRVRETLARHQRMLMRVRDFSLENGDAPATSFRLYPDPGRKNQ